MAFGDKMTAEEYRKLPVQGGKKVFGEGISQTPEKVKSDKGGNARRNKYNAQKTMYNGVLYDSKLEARVAYRIDMQMKTAAGKDKITQVERQVVFSFDHNGVHICKYVCDFVLTFADGHKEWWDAKGMELREGRIKSKLMQAYYGITVKLIKE
jgi:hypothetical protein